MEAPSTVSKKKMTSSVSKKCIEIEEDLWTEILKRLPIKKLGQFRCICKSWNSLISSFFFISTHLSFTNNHSSDDKSYIVFNPSLNSAGCYDFYNPQQIFSFGFPRIPFRSPKFWLEIMGVIHGVVCMLYSHATLLWNPAIHKYVILPPSSISNSLFVGFGFDAKNNDFKVLRIHGADFEAFSTRQGCWRKAVVADHIGQFSLPPCAYHRYDPHRGGCFSKGSIHWIIDRCDTRTLLVFECEREEFNTMELPQEINRCSDLPMQLHLYRGMLAVLMIGMGLWVMEDYGVASSWKMLSRPDHDDLVIIREKRVVHLHDVEVFYLAFGSEIEINVFNEKTSSYYPWEGYVFEPSMFFMNPESHALSYTVKHDDDGKIYYVKDGRRCDYVPLLPFK